MKTCISVHRSTKAAKWRLLVHTWGVAEKAAAREVAWVVAKAAAGCSVAATAGVAGAETAAAARAAADCSVAEKEGGWEVTAAAGWAGLAEVRAMVAEGWTSAADGRALEGFRVCRCFEDLQHEPRRLHQQHKLPSSADVLLGRQLPVRLRHHLHKCCWR